MLLAGGAGQPRDLPVPGRELKGIHFAMEYLTLQNRRMRGRRRSPTSEFITAKGKHVDHHRRRRHRRRLPRHRASPGRARRCISSSCCRCRRETRAADNPWPQWPQIFRVSTAHEEGGERLYRRVDAALHRRRGRSRARAARREGRDGARQDGRVQFEPVPGSEFEIPADLVLLAMGFVGPRRARCSTTSA